MTDLQDLFDKYKLITGIILKNATAGDIANIQCYAKAFENYSANILGKNWGFETTDFEVAVVRSAFGSVVPYIEVRTAVDIGGNIGDYTHALLKTFNEASIHVFEPNALNVRKLSNRFATESRVKILPYGVSESSGDGILWSCGDGSALASLAKRNLDHHGINFDIEEHIKLIRFEDYWQSELKGKLIDLVKIDVEGYELSVLKGFGKALDSTRIVQFEFSSGNIETRTFFQDFWYLFKNHGFSIYRITPYGLLEIDKYTYDMEIFTLSNYLAIKG